MTESIFFGWTIPLTWQATSPTDHSVPLSVGFEAFLWTETHNGWCHGWGVFCWRAKGTSRPVYVPWSLCFPDTFLSQFTTAALPAQSCLPPTLPCHTTHIKTHTYTHSNTPMLSFRDVLDVLHIRSGKVPKTKTVRMILCVCACVCTHAHVWKKHKISLISQVFLIDRDEIKRRANRDFYLFFQPLKCFYRETDPSSFMCWNNISRRSLFDTNKRNYCKNCNQSLTIRTNTLEYDSTETQL